MGGAIAKRSSESRSFRRSSTRSRSLRQVNQLMALVGGHPFLVKQACEYLQRYSHVTLDELLQTAPTEAGIYANYLRRYWEILQRHQVIKVAHRLILVEPLN